MVNNIPVPVEIMNAILEEAYYMDSAVSRDPDYTTLFACSLVNSSWTDPAQTLLFRHITRGKSRAFVSSHHFSAPNDRSSALLNHVRIVEIDVAGEPDQGCCSPRDLILLIAGCEKLYELSLHGRNLFSLKFNQSVYPALKAVTDVQKPTLRALRIFNQGVQSPILYELIGLFPTVRFLTIGTEIARMPPKDTIAGLKLYELILYRDLRPEVLSWLLGSSAGSLRSMELRDFPSTSTKTILACYAPHILSLRIMRENAHTAAIVRMCTQLQELVVNIHPFLPLPTLPSSLKHFAFVNQAYHSSEALLPIEHIRKHRNLKVLSCNRDSQFLRHFSELSNICETTGLVLNVNFPKIWTVDDPVPMKSFLRVRRSPSNYRLMEPRPTYN